MRNRTQTQVLENGAIRYAVYDEAGNFLRHDYLLPADDPTDVGTALSKENLLSDSTEVLLFGSAADRTIDGAFRGIGAQLKLIQANVANITVTVQAANGTPISDVLVGGIVSENGEAVYTNASGKVSGLIAEGNTEISVKDYADIHNYSEVLAVTKGTTITHTITVQTVNYMKLTRSKSVKFSGNVETVDVALGGGGASGNKASGTIGGTGGGMGQVNIQTGISVSPNTMYPAVIGAGGAALPYSYGSSDVTTGNRGGESSFLGVTASGGSPGVGGLGGRYPDYTTTGGADNGTASLYASFTGTFLYGGDGGGGHHLENGIVYAGAEPGTPGGGKCATTGDLSQNNGKNGLGGGGAGGAIGIADSGAKSYFATGAGGSGCVTFRMHLKSA